MTRPPPDAATAHGRPARRAAAAPEAAWIELSLRLPVADADLVVDALGVLAPGGAALEPPFRNVDPERFGLELIEGEAVVRAYFPAPLPQADRRVVRRRLAALPLAGALPRLRYAPVREDGWADAWKQHFRPLRIGPTGRLLVRPSWDEQAHATPGTLVVTLDPGRAFGTGQHATTRLCLEALERLVRAGDTAPFTVLDVGTGSGILALAAARLGATTVHALDTDPEALAAARENAARNALEDRIEVRAGSLGSAWPSLARWPAPPRGVYDLVVLNISSAVVVELLPAAAAALVPGGHLVASGFLREAAPRLEAAADAAGLIEVSVEHEISVEQDDEWSALLARAPTPGRAARSDAP